MQYESNRHQGSLELPFTIDITDEVCLDIRPTESVKEEDRFKAMPNLFTESFDIEYLASDFDENAHVRVSNLSGQVIHEMKVSIDKDWNRFEVDLSKYDLAKGLYQVDLLTNGKHENLKVVKAN